jgi:nicotinamide phosphoribosyltransferase
MMNFSPIYKTDFYKTSHVSQFPSNTELVYSNLTPRSSRMEGVDEMVFFGLQYFILNYLIEDWNYNFFMQNERKVVSEYEQFIKLTLGQSSVKTDHIRDLHRLGYLPIRIRAVKEGQLVPMRVACLTIENTLPEFYWLTNFLETAMSATLWGMCTSATTSFQYRKIAEKYKNQTVSDKPDNFVKLTCHDFSMRGMFGLEAAMMSGAAHLISFAGSDTIPAIHFLSKYYGADITKELVACSVSASEHAVMTLSAAVEGEFESFKRLITETYPNGIISLVCDSYDFYKVISEYLPKLKPEIMARDGKFVCRPDSSPKTPVEIICGDTDAPEGTPEYKGLIECLWDTFGGTYTENGYKLLDPHIGAIYGEAIFPDRQELIYKLLAQKGFASYNILFGVGSFGFQMKSRDSLGLAVKATAAVVGGKEYLIYKQPKTDDGTKNSARGFLKVLNDKGKLTMQDGLSRDESEGGALEDVFVDGKLLRSQTLAEIRGLIDKNFDA